MTGRLWLALTCLPLAISLGQQDYVRLKADESLFVVAPATGTDLAVRAATRTHAAAENLVEWARDVRGLRQQSAYVSAAGKFSSPPVSGDLAELFLDEEDLDGLRRCRPGNCDVKLNDAEIAHVRNVIEKNGEDWRSPLQRAYRGIVLERVRRYLTDGHNPWASYHDRRQPLLLDAEFAALASDVALTQPHLFPLSNYLSLYPRGDHNGVESFLYWAKESLGAKPILSITHVAIMDDGSTPISDAVVARKLVYASHYVTASLSLTTLDVVPGRADRYLVYLNHSRLDVLDGAVGGLVRRFVERRLKAEGPLALEAVRRAIERNSP
jgi:hypothetical protein